MIPAPTHPSTPHQIYLSPPLTLLLGGGGGGGREREREEKNRRIYTENIFLQHLAHTKLPEKWLKHTVIEKWHSQPELFQVSSGGICALAKACVLHPIS